MRPSEAMELERNASEIEFLRNFVAKIMRVQQKQPKITTKMNFSGIN